MVPRLKTIWDGRDKVYVYVYVYVQYLIYLRSSSLLFDVRLRHRTWVYRNLPAQHKVIGIELNSHRLHGRRSLSTVEPTLL